MGALRHGNLGYWLDEDLQNKGYMFEAANLVLNYAFDDLNLKRINAACLPHNVRSIKLLKKLGFEEEGYARKYFQINGVWQDHRLFGLCSDKSKSGSGAFRRSLQSHIEK